MKADEANREAEGAQQFAQKAMKAKEEALVLQKEAEAAQQRETTRNGRFHDRGAWQPSTPDVGSFEPMDETGTVTHDVASEPEDLRGARDFEEDTIMDTKHRATPSLRTPSSEVRHEWWGESSTAARDALSGDAVRSFRDDAHHATDRLEDPRSFESKDTSVEPSEWTNDASAQTDTTDAGNRRSARYEHPPTQNRRRGATQRWGGDETNSGSSSSTVWDGSCTPSWICVPLILLLTPFYVAA
ncbi:hypothetical protein DQ04_12111020 [Trypanosoma grayi]|uniref:hypothetical protein n=1 Tax=Trypanosoma grayi TaxID=71804 RepID=UPI0004F48BFE|nr:hypothetical protein DQ04_12111020 [Trypanosoma grayi]KEG06813.1 hypothetical protein DQ04_12111020 [Trypanosoma grayi]